MEYCVQAWSPHLQKDIQVLEKVQRAATKIVPRLKKYSYDDRLSQLGLTTLETRRRRGDLIEAFKIMTDREDLDKNLFFQLATSGYGLRGHSLKLAVPRCHLDIRKHSFSHRVVTDWNRLPEYVVMSPSVNAFKSRLDKHWTDMGT